MKLSARKSKKIVIKFVILFFIGICIYFFISQRVKIKLKSDELDNINKQIAIEKQKSEEIREKMEQASGKKDENKSSRTRVFENVAE